MLNQDQAKKLCDKVIDLTTYPGAFVSLSGMNESLSRYGINSMVQNVDRMKITLNVKVTKDAQSGTVSTTDLSDESIKNAVAQAETLAKFNRPDPEHQPPLGPQTYQKVDAYIDSTANCAPDERAKMVSVITGLCEASGAVSAGTCTTGQRFEAVADSAGLFGFHRWTTAGLTCTVRTADGTGSSRSLMDDVRDHTAIDPEALGRRTLKRATLSCNARELKPGAYPTLLEPQAAAMLVRSWILGNMDARAADEGRSPYSNRKDGGNRCGEKLLDSRLTFSSQPNHPNVLGCPFHGNGLPVDDTAWIKDGVLENLPYSRFWAKEKGKTATGPAHASASVSGETGTPGELLKKMKEGLLVTTLWYIRSVDPNEMLVTGLTRDGIFWVEDGEIAYPVKNFRFNDSPLRVFNDIGAMSAPQSIYGASIPAVLANSFKFTSISDAV
jgi:predicted Zn-dependent protease